MIRRLTNNRIFMMVLTLSLVANIGLAMWVTDRNVRITNMTAEHESTYSKAFSEMTGHMYELEQEFYKLKASGGGEYSSVILASIMRHAQGAADNLALLPLNMSGVSSLEKYLNQVSDYAQSALMVKASVDEFKEKHSQNLASMLSCTLKINERLNTMREDALTNESSWYELSNIAMGSDETGNNVYFSGFDSITEESVEYPTLIYDGPFSDALPEEDGKDKPSLGEEISYLDAASKVREVFSLSDDYKLMKRQELHCDVECWCVAFEKGEKMYSALVTKEGGHIVSFTGDGSSNREKLSVEDGLNRAQEFLENAGYISMAPQYFQKYNGNIVINFVYENQGIKYYSDMVKVRVNCDTGEINGFEGMNYVINHTSREHEQKEGIASMEEAMSLVSDGLSIEEISLALIPRDNGKELLCWEFRCEDKEDEEVYILYYDAYTLRQAEVFKVISTEDGDFVI
ncbi:MAG: hypothetical protein E7315_03130 [Clostridiales bacterium]|nr:hypothetical protein [Clostridiales bacterium]